jgi:beta-phosphoglucomutase-like phosphatase (HAD superfamily)
VACVERLARDFPLGIASGALRHQIETILARVRLDGYFRFVLAAGDTPHSKPWPDPYARAAELHAVRPSECVAIEDSPRGIESAQSAGLKCVGITTSYPTSALAAADRVIGSLDQFTTTLIRGLQFNP